MPTGALQNLLTAGAGRIQIFLAISLNLRGAASANGNLIPQFFQSEGQFGLIDGCGKLLRIEEALRLDGAWLTVLALSNIENDSVSMELRRHIPVHRASRVVLELGGHEFACCLGRMVSANARLRVVFQLFERDADTVTVRLTYAVIAAYQSR